MEQRNELQARRLDQHLKKPHVARILSLVLGVHDPDHLRVLQEKLLGPLFRHDETDHTDLITTLETYLDTACNGSRTAEILGVHRNSVNYRLQRIKELAEIDLEDADTRLLIQLILRATRGLCDQIQPSASAFVSRLPAHASGPWR